MSSSDAVIFSKDDGFAKIYGMSSSGGEGTELTPAGGWLFVQGITLSESPQSKSTHRVGAEFKREEVLARNITLSIERWHTGRDASGETDALLLGIDSAKEYIIKLYFYDEAEGETESESKLYTLNYCRPKGRTMATGRVNTITRKWSVGEIA